MALRDLLNAYKAGTAAPAPPPVARASKPAPEAATLSELLALQKYLLPHLATCGECGAEGGSYCTDAARDDFRGYLRAVANLPGGARQHDAFVAAVIQSRLKGVFAGLDALAQPFGNCE